MPLELKSKTIDCDDGILVKSFGWDLTVALELKHISRELGTKLGTRFL